MRFRITFILIFQILQISTISSWPDNCKWTSCEDHVIICQNICSKNKLGWYTGSSAELDCERNTVRCECCRATENGDRKWTAKCHQRRFAMVSACAKEFGHGYVPTGNKTMCSEPGTIKYECSN